MPNLCAICGQPTAGAAWCPPCAGLFRWVKGYFAHLPDRAGAITPATRFLADLAVESLDWMNWLLEAEEKLDIAIPDDRADRVGTVGEFIRLLRQEGASWPDGRDVVLRPRRRFWDSHVWDVVARPAPGRGDP